MRKPTIWVPTRSDTNQAVQSQKMVSGWKFWIYKVEELYYPCSENNGADQLRNYCEADLRLCFSHMQIVGFPMHGSNLIVSFPVLAIFTRTPDVRSSNPTCIELCPGARYISCQQ